MFTNGLHPSTLHRLTAGFAILVVVALNVLGAAPQLHAWVHAPEEAGEHAGHDHEPIGAGGHECAVTLFTHGVTGLLIFCLLMLVRPLARGIALRPSDWLILGRLRYWHVPSHAPPAV